MRCSRVWMRSSRGGWDVAEWLERLSANAEVATVLASIPASSDTMESEGWKMKHCWVSTYIKKSKKSPCLFNYQHNDKLIEPKRSAAIWLTLVSNRKGQPITGSNKKALQSWALEMRINWTAFKDNSNDRITGRYNKNLRLHKKLEKRWVVVSIEPSCLSSQSRIFLG
jgi:hypothetical protein